MSSFMSIEKPRPEHYTASYASRRDFLTKAGGGFGMLALCALLEQEKLRGATAETDPIAPKPQHFPAKAKSVIYLFMHGGPSHLDTFDPKPLLEKLDGQKLPESFRNLRLQFTNTADAPLLASRRKFQKYGQCGMDVSDLFPNVARHVDDLALIRSCHHEAFVHSFALNLMNTGSIRMGFPSVGSWVVYGLGSESRNLPPYIV